MGSVNIREIYLDREKYLEQTVTIAGWVRSIRSSKNFGFIVVNDGTFFEPLQVVYHDGMANFAEVEKLNVGAAIIVTGKLVATPSAKQPFEIQAEEVVIEGESAPDYPLQKKRHTFEYLRTISHLRPRTNTFEAVFRVRSLTAYAIHRFFQERDFVYVHTPLITGSDCEGAGEMFGVTTLNLLDVPKTEEGAVDFSKDFFGKATNLTVSGQLNGETYAMAFKNIYTFGPTFRAENSNTTRHAAEFWMIEPEIAFADLKDDMVLAESMLKYVIRYVLDHAPEEMQFFNNFVDKGLLERLNHVADSEFARVTYTEAVEILESYNGGRQYDNIIAQYLFLAGKKEEGKNRILKHCITDQIFVFNDLSILADMYLREEDYEKALLFLQAEITSYELFLREEGGYADRACAGKAYIISNLYMQIDKPEEAAKWYEKAKKHAALYLRNPSMLISSLRYCNNLEGRMIDSYGDILEKLNRNQ